MTNMTNITISRDLLESFIDPDQCDFDHHGGCQAHGYLSLQPGELCPHEEAKRLLAKLDEPRCNVTEEFFIEGKSYEVSCDRRGEHKLHTGSTENHDFSWFFKMTVKDQS